MYIFLGIVLAPLILMILDKTILPMRWTCKYMGWHNGNGSSPSYTEGDVLKVNLTSKCSKCGASVTQDSQGNWF
jgi:hypothetical protein